MKKVQRTISIAADLDEHIRQNNNTDFSKLVEEWYRENHLSIAVTRSKIRQHKKDLAELEKKLKVMIAVRKKQKKPTTNKEIEFWQKTVELIDQDEKNLLQRMKLYKKIFKKKTVSFSEFEKMLFNFRGEIYKQKLKAERQDGTKK